MTNQAGRFGIHGGQYIPETLMNAVNELEQAYNFYKNDPAFNAELSDLFNNYANRPSRLYFARKLTETLGGRHWPRGTRSAVRWHPGARVFLLL